ncbi:MAG TPA: hypothetical protein VGX26_01090 [Solirubrobacteraceae bacterium]|nr:hypothetical protein [Solirubrobacteraceae bacterium]
MSEHNWGTKAIIEAPVRETKQMVIAEVNKDSTSKIELKLDKERGTVFLNGHPFRTSAQMFSALARKVHLIEMQARRSREAAG